MAQDDVTVAALLRRRASDDAPGLRFEESVWSWADVVRESAIRAALLVDRRRSGPFHVGVLLDNVPDYLFWLGGAAISGATVVGINPTRRGAELERDIRHTDCQFIVTNQASTALLSGLATGVDEILVVDDSEHARVLAPFAEAALPTVDVDSTTQFLLLFTSGTTGAPKAVRCTQGRLTSIAEKMETLYGVRGDDVCYSAMPLFHGNALMALWAPALRTGACVALARRFSARAFLPDVRRFGATYFTYVGKVLSYVLATPELADDGDNPLERGFGNEASEPDIARFEQRFRCRIVEGYGASEGGASIVRVPGMPKGALGVGPEGTVVVDPETLEECPSAVLGDGGRVLNAGEAIGEIVNKHGSGRFEGYYKNDEAEEARTRNGWYWTGDLAYRDAEGFFYFAGRSADWLRVDGENFAAAPVERILARYPDIVTVAVYAVPDGRSGDQVMAAFELRPGTTFDPVAFGEFLVVQPDLGTKWAPRFVRIVESMPLTVSNKVVKTRLRSEAWECIDEVYWRPDRKSSLGTGQYVLLTDDDRAALRGELDTHGRLHLIS